MTPPLLSVVVVTRNRRKLLKRMLESLFRECQQGYPRSEIIVIDGGSADGTVELLQEHSERITRWISEPDKSVAEAVNKGVARSQGDIVRIIGDDDEVPPGSFLPMMTDLEREPDVDVLVGRNRVVVEDHQGNQRLVTQRAVQGRVTLRNMLKFPYDGMLIPECAFFRRSVFERFGPWDEQFRYWGFLEYFTRLVGHGACVLAVPREVLISYQTPQSDSIQANGSPRWKWERREVLRRHGNLLWQVYHWLPDRNALRSPSRFANYCCGALGIRPRKFLRDLKHRVCSRPVST